MVVYYAQIDDSGVVYAVTQAAGKMLEIQSLDDSLLGKKYNETTGQFEEVTTV